MKTWSATGVREMRSHTRAAIAGYRAARRVTGLAMRQSLQRHRAMMIASLRTAFVGPVRGAGPAGPGRGTGPPATLAAAERASVWELWPAPREEQEHRTDRSDELLQVVRVVQEHPEGICARDIGNELGTDWRRVLGLARSLVEAGLVDQVAEAYYPVVKAKR